MGFVEEIRASLRNEMLDHTDLRRQINSELWHACAGPLVSLPQIGSLVYYFPQGHSEQVAVSTKRIATSQIPNYPNLPSQLMCQVHNITMHADKDTDEIFAQMSLQPVNSEKDVFQIPDFGIRQSKHPAEFFCKTLTASDTSTHGGFSVPRRAAEKLFPQLDYTMQPPSQELVVRDLHENTWTFRHIYRGQPKRHLLTTGWSMFVGAKRLRAGDTILFIRDEKAQLLLGVRRANRQQTILPSSVLTADSMHIGVLAAAAHAAANSTPFTIFYNPRACPSQFVIPLAKYRKSLYGAKLSVGVRFGMMFETDESTRRRYMGTLVGISDLDPLRWPSSKWRNLQVEWDEPGCGDKKSRVSAWEIETPESLFIFPSITSGLKQPLYSGFLGADMEWKNLSKRPYIPGPENVIMDNSYLSVSNLSSEKMIDMLLKSQPINHPVTFPSPLIQDVKPVAHATSNKQPRIVHSEATSSNVDSRSAVSQSNLDSQSKSQNETQSNFIDINQNILNQLMTFNSNPSPWAVQPQQMDLPPQYDCINSNNSLPNIDTTEWSTYNSMIFPEEVIDPMPHSINHETWGPQLNSINLAQFPNQDLKDFSAESNNHSGVYSCMNYDTTNSGSALIDPSVSSVILDDFGLLKDSGFQNVSNDCLVGNFSCSQDVQSQITTSTRHEFQDNSGVTSSINLDFGDSILLQSNSWAQVPPPMRTYTKVQKAGSVGRSIDVASYRNYEELCCGIERMFSLEGLLNDPISSGWKLVYVDYENDVLLVGDDPWEVFVGCVRCIRILSPCEVEKMSEEGMQLLDSAAEAAAQAINCDSL